MVLGFSAGSKVQGTWRCQPRKPSGQYQSLPSANKIEMLNQHTDGQCVMLAKHIPRTRTFLFSNKPLIGPSLSSKTMAVIMITT